MKPRLTTRTRFRPRAARAVFAGAVLCVGVLGASCGVKGLPRPPEATAPVIDGALEAERTEAGIMLTWPRANRSADGERLYDLAAFTVERRSGDQGFEPLSEISVTDSDRIRKQRSFEFLDSSAPAGEVTYRVIARTAEGQNGPPSTATVSAQSN